MLASYPDQQFAAFLHRCIEQGFRIRVPPSRVLHTHSTHLPSAASNSELISRCIAEEVRQAHLRHCSASPSQPHRHHPKTPSAREIQAYSLSRRLMELASTNHSARTGLYPLPQSRPNSCSNRTTQLGRFHCKTRSPQHLPHDSST